MGCKLSKEHYATLGAVSPLGTYTVEIRSGAVSLLLLIDRCDNQRFNIEGLIFVTDENPRGVSAVFVETSGLYFCRL